MARIVFYPRRINYTFFNVLRYKERVEVSVPDYKIRVLNSNTVKIDTSVLQEIGIIDKHVTINSDWSFWYRDMNFEGEEYPREVDLAL